MKRTVLFLCTGDTCRGPMAAGLTAKLLLDLGVRDIEVRSAGVMTVNGLLATAETAQLLKAVSATLERHRSTPVSVDLLKKCDLILGMTPLHVQHALRMTPEIKGRVFLLKEFTRSDLKKVQIDDPMGNTLEVYKKVFSEIKSACQKFVKLSYVTGKDDGKDASKRAAAKAPLKKVAVAKGSNGSSNGAKKKVKSVAAVAPKAAKKTAVAAPVKAKAKKIVKGVGKALSRSS